MQYPMMHTPIRRQTHWIAAKSSNRGLCVSVHAAYRHPEVFCPD